MHALHAHSMKSHTPTPAQGQNCAHLPNHVIISLAGIAYTAVYPIAQSGHLTAALASDQASLPLDLAHARALQELKERCWLSILKWRKVGTRVMVQVSVRPHTRAHTLHMNLFSTPFHIKPDEQRSHRHDGLQPHQCKEAVQSAIRSAVTHHSCSTAISRAKCINSLLMAHCSVDVQNRLTAGLYFCTQTYEDVLFIQVCSDPTPLHSSTVQGEFINHCSVLPC